MGEGGRGHGRIGAAGQGSSQVRGKQQLGFLQDSPQTLLEGSRLYPSLGLAGLALPQSELPGGPPKDGDQSQQQEASSGAPLGSCSDTEFSAWKCPLLLAAPAATRATRQQKAPTERAGTMGRSDGLAPTGLVQGASGHPTAMKGLN